MTRSGADRRLSVVVIAPPWFEVPPAGYGGIERMCSDLVDGLVARGHAVTLVANGRRRTEAEFVQALPETPTGLGEVEGPAQEVRYAAIVAGLLRDVSADVFHDHSLAGPLTWAARPAPTVVTVHGPVRGAIGDYFRRLGLPTVAISGAQRASAPDLPWAGMVHNCIDVSAYPFEPHKEPYALFVGRMSPEKGVHVAVEAAAGAGVPLVIAGKCKERDEKRYFDSQVAPRLASSTTWLGEVSGADRTDLFARARCLLFTPQWDEPFGLVTVEALACGTPVVALGRGAVFETVDHGRTGFVCPTPDSLATAIGRAADIDPHACRAAASERFDVPVMAAGYERVYCDLLDGRAQRR